jgi:hypothetical protein
VALISERRIRPLSSVVTVDFHLRIPSTVQYIQPPLTLDAVQVITCLSSLSCAFLCLREIRRCRLMARIASRMRGPRALGASA